MDFRRVQLPPFSTFSKPILFSCDFALALRIPDAQQVMIGLSFARDFTPAANC